MVTANKKSTKGGTQDKAEKAAKKAEKEKRQKKAARDGSWIPVAGPPKSDAELAAQKLRREAVTIADGKEMKGARKERVAARVAKGEEPKAAAQAEREIDIEATKAQVLALREKNLAGKHQPLRDKTVAPVETTGTDSEKKDKPEVGATEGETNGSKAAAAGGEEQTDMQNDHTTPEMIETAAAPAAIETLAEVLPAEAVVPAKPKSVQVKNLRDLQQYVNLDGDTAVIDPCVQLVSADPETPAPLTLTTTFVVEVLQRDKKSGRIETKGYEFYPEEDAKLYCQAQNEGFNLTRADMIRPGTLVDVLREKKKQYDLRQRVAVVKFRELVIWQTRADILAHMSDPLANQMVFGALHLEDKVRNAILNSWADFREGFAVFIDEGDLHPESLEEWAEVVENFEDAWTKRPGKKMPRFPFRFVWTNFFREADDGAVVAVPNSVFDAVADELESQGVRFKAAWPHRWLLITQGAQPWFAEQAAERKAQEAAQRKAQEEAARRRSTLNKFQQRLLENGARVPAPIDENRGQGQRDRGRRDDRGGRREERGGRREERGGGGRHVWERWRYDSARD